MKNSDHFSNIQRNIRRMGNRFVGTAIVMVAIISMAFAGEPYIFVEGSTHSFHVTPGNPSNSLEWAMYIDPYNDVPMLAKDYSIQDNSISDVVVTFNDINRIMSELVYLVVKETAPNGCSTKRALQILLEPNNMYLEFASAETQECFSIDGEFNAPLRVGLNFMDKNAGVPIPEKRFPLMVNYKIENKTAGTPAIAGNKGLPVELAYSAINDYYLLVTEAVGQLDQTTEYELTIENVTDKYKTEISNNAGDVRIQIRVINHLPQSSGMDMALSYVVSGIEYTGEQ